jgi:formiminoglutamase
MSWPEFLGNEPTQLGAVLHGNSPLILSIPHAGRFISSHCEAGLVSKWLARKDADWWLPQLYDFQWELGATIIQNSISRTVIDVNRDPSGVSLYPGQVTTGLCPTETFDGEPLYQPGMAPDEAEIASRRAIYFESYHNSLETEIARLKAVHDTIVVYDCHSIRGRIPRLFPGELPNFNIGSNDNKSCDPKLTEAITAICAAAQPFTHVVNGRFKGGYITRHYGDPANGVHAIQMELACRGYMHEPETPDETNWPAPYDEAYAAPMRDVLKNILQACIEFAGATP